MILYFIYIGFKCIQIFHQLANTAVNISHSFVNIIGHFIYFVRTYANLLLYSSYLPCCLLQPLDHGSVQNAGVRECGSEHCVNCGKQCGGFPAFYTW